MLHEFSIFFANHTTGEVVQQNRRSVRASAAIAAFRRRMREYGTLNRGDRYKLVAYDSFRDLSTFWPDLDQVEMQVAR